MSDSALNPLAIKIENIMMHKFSTGDSVKDEINLLPQFVELSIYQSVFEPVIKAEMLVNDNIGLFVNYPMTGEEVITIEYSQLDAKSSNSVSKKLHFIIRGIKNVIIGDRARSMMFTVELSSVEFLQNTRKYISHAYYDTVDNMADQLFNEYIYEDTVKTFGVSKEFIFEESDKVRAMVIPNLRPFPAIQWLAKHAVSINSDTRFLYMFFENSDGFNFVTVQKLIEDGLAQGENMPKFFYIANKEAVDNDRFQDPDIQTKLITNIVFNKRFSTVEKVSSGYYQNELFEISMLQKAYHSTPTEIKAEPQQYTIEPFVVNTPEYIDYVKNEIQGTEYSNRIRYIINNFKDFDSGGSSQPSYRKKFGKATQHLIALNQVDITITVPANMDLKAGQLINVTIPKMHGFNEVEEDPYLSGNFLVNEVRQVVGTGGRASTSLRIYKDSYTQQIKETTEYALG